MKTNRNARLAGGRRRAACALTLLAGLGGCNTDSLLEVPDPDVVSVPVFEDPENLQAVRAGVVREFARAMTGTQNNEGGQIIVSGTLADEIYHSGTFTDRQEVDARATTLTNNSNATAFFWIQRARNHAELAGELFAASDEAGSDSHAEVLVLAGYSYVMVGENYCSGVPFSKIPIQGAQEFGVARTTEEIFGLAVERFDAALAFGPAAELSAVAHVGRGRALLNLGRYEDAAQAVAQVPTGFQRDVAYSDAVLDAYNAVWNLVNAERRWSAAGSEGTNGLPYLTNGDPRTPTEFDGPAFDNRVSHYSQLAYAGPGSDVPLATGIEARLIEAEAALRAGDRDGFFTKHAEVRATAGLGALVDSGQSDDALVDLHFRERAYWMWLTSHRLGDLRRLVRQYGRPASSVYPVGPTELGESRGDHVALPVPFTETNNPNYDPSACDPRGA
jgi:hypothetical protein